MSVLCLKGEEGPNRVISPSSLVKGFIEYAVSMMYPCVFKLCFLNGLSLIAGSGWRKKASDFGQTYCLFYKGKPPVHWHQVRVIWFPLLKGTCCSQHGLHGNVSQISQRNAAFRL